MFRYLMFTAITLVLFAGNSFADWPQYLGPNRDGTSSETGILRTWPEDGPEVLWTAGLGAGFGGPAVSDEKVYLLDRDDQVGDILRCYELATGDELWNFAYNAPGSFRYPGSRCTPIIDGNNIYTCGPYGQLYCIDKNTHQPVWNKNIWTDFGGGNIPTWAITQNPLIYGDAVIVSSQAPDAGLVSYDKLTGDVKWTSDALPGGVGYVSPSLVKIADEDQLVMITAGQRSGEGGDTVVGIDPENGDFLWTYNGFQCIIPVPHAVDVGDGERILIVGGYNAGSVMLKIEKDENSYNVTELFKTVEFGTHTQPPILYEGHFYGQYTTNERNDGLICMSLDGEIKWKTGRSPAFNKGGMVLADDLLLAVDGNTMLYLIEPSPDEFKPISSVTLLQAGTNWAPIVLVDGKLFIRDQQTLFCLAVK